MFSETIDFFVGLNSAGFAMTSDVGCSGLVSIERSIAIISLLSFWSNVVESRVVDESWKGNKK